MPNHKMIPSIFDGAGAIEKIVSVDKVEELHNKVNNEKLATGQLSNAELIQVARNIRTKPVLRDYKKIGRNDPCPCGSGKKYKHCCLKTGKYETQHQIGE